MNEMITDVEADHTTGETSPTRRPQPCRAVIMNHSKTRQLLQTTLVTFFVLHIQQQHRVCDEVNSSSEMSHFALAWRSPRRIIFSRNKKNRWQRGCRESVCSIKYFTILQSLLMMNYPSTTVELSRWVYVVTTLFPVKRSFHRRKSGHGISTQKRHSYS